MMSIEENLPGQQAGQGRVENGAGEAGGQNSVHVTRRWGSALPDSSAATLRVAVAVPLSKLLMPSAYSD